MIDVIKPWGGSDWMRKYAPRYLEFVREAAGIAVAAIGYSCFPLPEKRLEIVQVPGFLQEVMKQAMDKPPEAYPG